MFDGQYLSKRNERRLRAYTKKVITAFNDYSTSLFPIESLETPEDLSRALAEAGERRDVKTTELILKIFELRHKNLQGEDIANPTYIGT